MNESIVLKVAMTAPIRGVTDARGSTLSPRTLPGLEIRRHHRDNRQEDVVREGFQMLPRRREGDNLHRRTHQDQRRVSGTRTSPSVDACPSWRKVVLAPNIPENKRIQFGTERTVPNGLWETPVPRRISSSPTSALMGQQVHLHRGATVPRTRHRRRIHPYPAQGLPQDHKRQQEARPGSRHLRRRGRSRGSERSGR